MAKGENIFKRKDGRWEARYIKGYEPSGKIKYGYCYGKTYKTAKEKVTAARASVHARPLQAPVHHQNCLAFYCDEWLRINRSRIKESTYVKYAAILEKHIKPGLGGYSLSDLSTIIIGSFSEKLLSQNLAPKSVRDVLVLLHSIIGYISQQFPDHFPAIDIIYPKDHRKEMRVLTVREQTTLVQYLASDMDACKFSILLALLTGIRIGELCALRWQDISVEDRTIHIHASMQRLKSPEKENGSKTRVVITSPKSEKSVRTIPMTEQTALLCMRMEQKRKTAYLVTGNEHFMEPRALQYRFSKYVRDCGLEGVHFHTLRHTFATRCVEVGFEIKTLSEILGHSSPNVTLERYVHSSMELKRLNMHKLEAVGL